MKPIWAWGGPAETAPARWAAAAVIALGGAVIAAWFIDIAALKSVGIGAATMKFNTALSFVLSGVALWAASLQAKMRAPGGFAAAAAAAIGVATLAEYVFDFRLGIDEIVVRDVGAEEYRGRMSAVAALNFALFGVAYAASRKTSRRASLIFSFVALLGLAIAFLALMGYLFGAPVLYRPLPFTAIAFHTVLGFIVLFAGMLAARPHLGLVALLRGGDAGSAFARRTLPVVLVPIPAIGCAILALAVDEMYGIRLALAIFAIATVALLTAVIWVTSRHVSALEEARIAQQRIRTAVIEGALDAFVLMDSRGRIIEWNPQAERMFGWPRAEALGLTIAETIIPPTARDSHEHGLARFLATEQGPMLNRRNELIARRRDGTEIPVELIATPVRVRDEWAFGGFIRDVSERKKTEAALRQSQKMEAVGQLTGGVAHDFNNLLTVIIGSLDSIIERSTGKERARLESAMGAAERGAALTQRLLAFSRRQALEPAALDLNVLVTGMEDLLRRTLGATIDIEVRVADGLWRAFADKSQTENALLNLTINARDAMPGGGRLTIETANVKLDDHYAASNAEGGRATM